MRTLPFKSKSPSLSSLNLFTLLVTSIIWNVPFSAINLKSLSLLISVKNISGVVSDIVKLPVTVAPVEVVSNFLT